MMCDNLQHNFYQSTSSTTTELRGKLTYYKIPLVIRWFFYRDVTTCTKNVLNSFVLRTQILSVRLSSQIFPIQTPTLTAEQLLQFFYLSYKKCTNQCLISTKIKKFNLIKTNNNITYCYLLTLKQLEFVCKYCKL